MAASSCSSSSSLSSSRGLLAVALVSSALLFHSVCTATTWCVARSHVSQKELQTALDYACGAGADCAPIQADGLCYLPNNIEAHASYAFNSFYQKKGMAPGSCDFADTAAVASTDPSYGSCVYPSSARYVLLYVYLYVTILSFYLEDAEREGRAKKAKKEYSLFIKSHYRLKQLKIVDGSLPTLA